MDNNKNRMKDRTKSNAELRKMYFDMVQKLALKMARNRGKK